MNRYQKYLQTNKIAQARWAKNNRARINQKRNELRARKRKERLGDKKCLLCGIVLKYDSKRTRVYCRHCRDTAFTKINRDSCKRYYQRKKAMV